MLLAASIGCNQLPASWTVGWIVLLSRTAQTGAHGVRSCPVAGMVCAFGGAEYLLGMALDEGLVDREDIVASHLGGPHAALVDCEAYLLSQFLVAQATRPFAVVRSEALEKLRTVAC